MFQKCPYCTEETEFPLDLAEELFCPVCLNELIIHTEQGVPPSKVRMYLPFDETNPLELKKKKE